LVPAQAYVGRFLETFKDFPPRQAPGSFSLGDAMQRLRRASAN
jgi:arylsulfatase